MRKQKKNSGLSLVEVLIAISLFAIVAVVSSNILISIVHLEKKTSIQNAIYEDLKIILQQLTFEIQQGTIDYEEYYNYYVLQDGESAVKDVYYGINYGVYGSRFYDPGKSLDGNTTYNPDDLGIECSYPDPLLPGDECEVVYTLSMDLNTGHNPFDSPANADKSNAFNDLGIGKKTKPYGESDHLFLIDKSGTKKTIISRKLIKGGKADDYAIGLVRMDGLDLDQNGIIDTFTCSEEFDCFGDTEDEAKKLAEKINLPIIEDGFDILNKYKITVPVSADLYTPFEYTKFGYNSNFVPLSPLRSNIKDLRFVINPVEDPYRAYGEPKMQSHPSVTIYITIGLSSETAEEYPGEFNDVTIQTTVAAGVIGRIDSYPPINDIMGTSGDSWIMDALPPGLRVP